MTNNLALARQYAEDVRDGRIEVNKYVKKAIERHYRDLDNAEARGWYFSDKSAEKAIKFYNFLALTKGVTRTTVPKDQINPDGSIRFQLAPWQAFAIASIFGWKKKENKKRRFNEVYIEIPKKNGKALALDTLIPTPSGWTTMGKIKDGEVIFDERGEQCRVVATTEVMHGRRCYEVEFSDGIKVVADAEHLWETEVGRYAGTPGKGKHGRSNKVVLTTENIKSTLSFTQGIKEEPVFNHRIAVAKAIKPGRPYLPVHPYVLGFWLGDGHSASARVTISHKDLQSLVELGKCVEVGTGLNANKDCFLVRLGSGSRTQKARDISVQADLREMGLLNNKHIPKAYLRADLWSRKELLKGLMDTDGYASKAGQCEFTTTSFQLYEDFMDLARGLGYKPSVKIGDAKLNGRIVSKKYRIQFWAFKENSCFKLNRKTDRLKTGSQIGKRSNYRQIVAVKEVESVPVRCIQVDSPSKLFLCSKGYIPTHNSTMASGFANYMLTADREAGPEVYFAAYSQDQAGICFDEAVAQIKDSKALRKIVKFFKYSVVTAKGRGKMMAVSHDGNNTEGKNSSAAVIDEYHVHKTDKVKDSLGTGMSARDQPILFVVTTAGYNKNGPCYQHRQMCIDMLEHGKEIDHIFTLIYGIDEDDDWQDEKNWVKANPTLGITTKISQIRNEFQVALRSGSKEVDFKTKRLNMWVDSAVTWIKSEYWKANFKKGEDGKKFVPPRGSWCYAGIDLGRSSDISAVCLYFPEYSYLMYKYYVAEDAAEYAARNGIDYNEWIRQGYLKSTPGRTTDYNIIHREILEMTGEWDVKIIGYDPYGAQKFKDDLAEELGTIWVAKKQDDGSTKPDDYAIMQVVRQGFQILGPATALFEKEVLDGTLTHDGNPITGWMLGNVQLAIDINGNMRPSKNKSADKIDGIAATCNALAVFSEWHKSIEESTGILAW